MNIIVSLVTLNHFYKVTKFIVFLVEKVSYFNRGKSNQFEIIFSGEKVPFQKFFFFGEKVPFERRGKKTGEKVAATI